MNNILLIGIFVLVIGGVFLFSSNSEFDESSFDSSIDLEGVISGGVPKGGIGVDVGIPALAEENINFVSVQEADEWINDDELVLALEYNGVKRVYPLQIMVWHEIANDRIGDELVIVTYCPLCGSGIAYSGDIEVDGKKVESRFGTSGKLYNSNLIMYDEETSSYWQQIGGFAIAGELFGERLERINLDTVSWKDWKEKHPDSEVLSKDTGISRNYGNDPYGSYYEDDSKFFPVNNEDDRIHSKTPIVGVELGGKFKAYRREDVIESGLIEDEIGGVNIGLEALEDGRIVVINLDDGIEIVKEEDFWFAWYAFHPETELYGF
jgi:hypothetical protein